MAVIIEKSRVRIENAFIAKELSLKSGKIVSSTVENRLSGRVFSPLDGSSEFKIRFLSLFGGEFVSGGDNGRVYFGWQ